MAFARAPIGGETSMTVEALYTEHLAVVWRVLRRLGVQAASLDDAVQDVFVVVHRRLGELDFTTNPRALLAGIALGVARNYRRTQRRRGEPEALSERTADLRADPSHDASRSEAARHAQAILDSLDEDKRVALVLADLEGLSGPQIAEVLKVNLNTVYTRLRAARLEFNAAAERLQGERT